MKKRTSVIIGMMMTLCMGVMPVSAAGSAPYEGTSVGTTTVDLEASAREEKGTSVNDISDTVVISYKLYWNKVECRVTKKSDIPKKWNPSTFRYDLDDTTNTKDTYKLTSNVNSDLTKSHAMLYNFYIENYSNAKLKFEGTGKLNSDLSSVGLKFSDVESVEVDSAAKNVTTNSETGEKQTGSLNIYVENATDQQVLKAFYEKLGSTSSTIGSCDITVSVVE